MSSFPPALGMLELSSVARGIESTDFMLKASSVDLVLARTICSGKYMVMVAGEVDAVESSVKAGIDIARECAIDDFVIPNVHPDVFSALSGTNEMSREGSLGVLESFSVASLIQALDAVSKAARVEVVECKLAMALGGKACLVFTGDVEAVRYSIEAGAQVLIERGLLVNQVVIADPRPELFNTLV